MGSTPTLFRQFSSEEVYGRPFRPKITQLYSCGVSRDVSGRPLEVTPPSGVTIGVNERIKRRYFAYLKEAKRRGEESVDAVAKALNRFELDTRFRSFKSFRPEQAVAFKRHLVEQTNARTERPLAKATIHSTLAALKAFFIWLAGQPGYRSRLSYSDADYFNLSDRDARIAQTRLDKPAPRLEDVRRVILSMPAETAVECRDRALIAFILLTGARDGAVASLKIKHLDLATGRLVQDAREIRTKFGKTITTIFFPVGDDIRKIVEDWVQYLERKLFWGPEDPLFPATLVETGIDHTFQAAGVARRHWSSAEPIRAIFRRAFSAVGLPSAPSSAPHARPARGGTLSESRSIQSLEPESWA